MTANLLQFLRARLDEDEQAARAAAPGPWAVDGGSVYVGHPVNEVVDYSESATHIARHDPARVLAEVDAKRQALEHYERIQQHTLKSDGGADYIFAEGAVRKQIQYMALTYAARHPDYLPEWAPDPV